ncbi:hypothetical protein E2C01_073154 [Portunus trituberculatus]|uniref:Uncharacterized protein n=1 Tax=Portunus trituberculatus TaxID=210409 RepID=A0A5B7I229_PORTR|nr:hypothetical protein [Portunus trituberculatus]
MAGAGIGCGCCSLQSAERLYHVRTPVASQPP